MNSEWYEPSTTEASTAVDDAMLKGECYLCGAPGGYPYCNSDCEAADNPEDYEDEE